MSYDLEVRFDEDYSRTAPLPEIAAFLVSKYGAETLETKFLIVEDMRKQQRVEIDLLGVDECIETAVLPSESADEIAAIGLGVPHSLLGSSSEKLFDIAFGLARELGWRVYDPQTDGYISKSEEPSRKLGLATSAAAVPTTIDSSVDEEPPSLVEEMFARAYDQKLPSLVVVMLIAAGLASYVVFWHGIVWGSQERTFGLVLAIGGIGILHVRALAAAMLERRRRLTTRSSGRRTP